MKSLHCVNILLIALSGLEATLAKISTVEHVPGHYPNRFCKITNSILDTTSKTFVAYGKSTENISATCKSAINIWPVESRTESQGPLNCSRYFKHGHAFTIYYWSGRSNYFHLTYDMMLPLYQQIYYKKGLSSLKDGEIVFMPTVETTRLKALDWETPAFETSEKYWVQMSKFMAVNHAFKPLQKTILTENGNICFDELYLGTPVVNYADADLVQGFIQFVKSLFAIKEIDAVQQHRLALVSRKKRRKILNENKVVSALQSVIPADLVEFSGMSFAQQVQTMQKYTVFAALNGAGLMNALYLPKHAVAIQMVPYQAQLNVNSYGILLKARGPYLEWHNTREDLTQTIPGDAYTSMPNTIVDIDDFKNKVKEAMELYDVTVAKSREEL